MQEAADDVTSSKTTTLPAISKPAALPHIAMGAWGDEPCEAFPDLPDITEGPWDEEPSPAQDLPPLPPGFRPRPGATCCSQPQVSTFLVTRTGLRIPHKHLRLDALRHSS